MLDLEPPPPARKKLTIWLIVGGVASLLLPLAGVIYLRVAESRALRGPSGRSNLFEHREGGEVKITPTQTVVIPNSAVASPPPMAEGIRADSPPQPGGSSLDFIKMSAELKARTEVPAPTTKPAQAPAQVETKEAPVEKPAAKTVAKNGKKPFAFPKLQPSRGFSSFKGGKDAKKGAAGAQNTQALDPQAAGAGGGQDMSEMLKNLPPGAENDPRIQEYLKKHK